MDGSRDGKQPLMREGAKFLITLKDLKSVCPVNILDESSLQMPWLTDEVSVNQLLKDFIIIIYNK